MSTRPDTDDYLALFLNDTPLMDVRAPVEFEKGSFPCAENAPLMNDEERHEIGICYKEQGQNAAIDLGHKLVSGQLKSERVERWVEFAKQHPQGYLFCFRGGLRSRTTQQWMAESGVDYPLVKGGYKALRRFLIDQTEAIVAEGNFILVSGRTGTGKTRVLQQLPNPVDLEGLANHRGSSFGREVTPQPSQIDFENRLAVGLLKAVHHHTGPIYLEDESRLVGRCALPDSLRLRMQTAPLMLLEQSLEERIAVIREDYVEKMVADYTNLLGKDEGWAAFEDYLLSALHRIRKRLGGERYQNLNRIMESALEQQKISGDTGGHDSWIAELLTDYYDPMYDYQLEHKEGRVVVRGSPEDLISWAALRS